MDDMFTHWDLDVASTENNNQSNQDAQQSISPPRIGMCSCISHTLLNQLTLLADNAGAVQPIDSTDTTKPSASTATTQPTNGQPLGPPPRPAGNGNSEPDYFSQFHNPNEPNAYTGEPNPFEVQFGNPSAETPGKLPGVASLTSPQPLLPSGTPGWSSLRSGPLSPAMLAGPTGGGDYFGEASFGRGFPTPNESSLRTGLTPGGGGSMFPAPSPNTQALFNALQPGGGATPGTVDFLRTVNRATALNNSFTAPTSQPTDPNLQPSMDQKYQNQQPPTSDPFGHPDQDAVNGLYMLANNGGARAQMPMAQSMQANMGQMNNMATSQETSPTSKRRAKNSVDSIETADMSGSEASETTRPATRSTRGKNAKNAKGNRRKADDAPAKGPPSKKAKGSNGAALMDDDDDEGSSPKMDDDTGKGGKKMTDEEKRKNFLERNRYVTKHPSFSNPSTDTKSSIAALKCRQRKKQWLANLQAKVELFSTENDALSQTVTQLREEIVNLKSLLLAHRDCPVSAAQGIGGANMNMFIEGHSHVNPYGMAAQPNGAQMAGQQMGIMGGMPGQRRSVIEPVVPDVEPTSDNQPALGSTAGLSEAQIALRECIGEEGLTRIQLNKRRHVPRVDVRLVVHDEEGCADVLASGSFWEADCEVEPGSSAQSAHMRAAKAARLAWPEGSAQAALAAQMRAARASQAEGSARCAEWAPGDPLTDVVVPTMPPEAANVPKALRDYIRHPDRGEMLTSPVLTEGLCVDPKVVMSSP